MQSGPEMSFLGIYPSSTLEYMQNDVCERYGLSDRAPALQVQSPEFKLYSHQKKKYIWMFYILSIYQHPKYLSMGNWLNKSWYSLPIEYHTSIEQTEKGRE
jgi:hypothetical protein